MKVPMPVPAVLACLQAAGMVPHFRTAGPQPSGEDRMNHRPPATGDSNSSNKERSLREPTVQPSGLDLTRGAHATRAEQHWQGQWRCLATPVQTPLQRLAACALCRRGEAVEDSAEFCCVPMPVGECMCRQLLLLGACLRHGALEISEELVVINIPIAGGVHCPEQLLNILAFEAVTQDLSQLVRRDEAALVSIEARKGPAEKVFVRIHVADKSGGHELAVLDLLAVV
mmetsp:Transcript_90671/g.282385  ORF Transcript_90671/g.282385 Transcript_90671/m.282385 type:complete len:228 (-) Transcript_90671:1296-1979(-)